VYRAYVYLLKRQAEVEILPLALRWVMSNIAITAPIIGARNLSQLKDSLEAVSLHIDPKIIENITKLSDTPSNATDRLEEALDDRYKLRNR